MTTRLNQYFPRGTIGYKLVYQGNVLDGMFGVDVPEHPEAFFRSISDLESETPNSDEVLRAFGLYDSTDKRSCINRKKR